MAGRDRPGLCVGCRGLCGGGHLHLRSHRVFDLRGGGRDCALAQFLSGGFAGPCARIDIADDVQPILSLGERREITHVKTETLAALLEAATDEEGEALQLRKLRLLERHRRRRGA